MGVSAGVSVASDNDNDAMSIRMIVPRELESVEEEIPSDRNFQAAEREHVLRVLRECKGMIGGSGGAAEKLGLKRTTLNSKLRKLGIERADYA